MVTLTLSNDMNYQDYELAVANIGGCFKVTDLANGGTIKEISGARTGETYEFFRKFGKLHYHKKEN